MFGKPQWFRPKRIGWGIVPVTWQGWGYTLAWSGAMVLPFLVLLGRRQPVEAMLWMGLSIGALSYDVWNILRTYRTPTKPATLVKNSRPAGTSHDDHVLYIGESEAVATQNYSLCARR